VTCGSGFGGLLIPVIVSLIDGYGWRSCLTILATATLALLLPLSFIFRHKPEHYGYLPDGEAAKTETTDTELDPPDIDNAKPSMKRLLTSSPFWHLAASFTIFHMVMISVVAHIMPYLSSINMTRANSSIIATIIPLMSIIGSFSFGRLGDKIDRKKVTAGTYAMACTGLFCLALASVIGLWTLVPFLLFYGIGHGGSNAMRPSLTSDVFGRGNFGKIFGLMVGINSLISSIGPIIAGWAYDSWGSYQNIWFIFAGLILISFFSVLTIPKSTLKPARLAE
jgi:MFS family permease